MLEEEDILGMLLLLFSREDSEDVRLDCIPRILRLFSKNEKAIRKSEKRGLTNSVRLLIMLFSEFIEVKLLTDVTVSVLPLTSCR